MNSKVATEDHLRFSHYAKMSEIHIDMKVLLLVEVIGALSLAVILQLANRIFRRPYMGAWVWSWVVAAALFGCALLAASKAGTENVIVNALLLVLPIVRAALIFGGAFHLARHRPLHRRSVAFVIVVLVIVAVDGLVSDAIFGRAQALALSAFAVAVFAFVSAFQIIRYRASRTEIGMKLMGAALVAVGLERFTRCVELLAHASLVPLGELEREILRVAILGSVGVGMLLCVLEDQREAAELAAAQVEHLAYHDPLTGLPNRALFFDRLIVALAHGDRYAHKTAVLFLDIDRFKNFNDSLGHAAGDIILKTAARRLQEATRKVDTVARFGGDEFTIIMQQIESVDAVARVAQKILENLRTPFIVGNRELAVTSSIGIAIHPEDGEDANSLVRNADSAMYRAKDLGRDCYQLYTSAMNEQTLATLDLESRLRHAIDQRELIVYYQPLVDLRTNGIFGYEALIRWQHPTLGLLSPGQFIPLAESSGLIVPMGYWILEEACRQAARWGAGGIERPILSVNLSARQLQQRDLVARVKLAIAESGIEPDQLELEITESNAMQNPEYSIRLLHELRSFGVRIALDDFGTGYSSLGYLRKLPIDTLKLDKEFIKDIADGENAAIVTAVIAMAHSLGLTVIAEGVETERQLEFLREQHCDRIQGYICSVPLPPHELEMLMLGSRFATA